jgi:uncharacterized membrane protein
MASIPTLSRAKSLGEVGSILVLLTAIPSIGWLVGIVGFVLLLFAIKDLSEIVGDRKIFNNMLVAVGLGIAAMVVGALVIVGSVLRFIGLNNLSLGPSFNASSVPAGDWAGLIGSILVGLAAVWIIMIVSAVYVRRTYGALSSSLKVGAFDTAGSLYLAGAATTIILVGFVLLLVAEIMVVVSFFSIPEKPPMVAPAMAVPATV